MCAMCFETLTLFSDQNYQISQYLIVELDSCSQKEFYMIKKPPDSPTPPPICTDPGSSRAQNIVQFLTLKSMGLHKPISRSYEGVPHLPPDYKGNGANDYITSLKYLFLFLS